MKTPPLGCAVLLALVVASAMLALLAQAPPPAPSPAPKDSCPASADYDLRWGVKIPMRDKVELNATLYVPRTKDGTLLPTPVIFTLTPYISDSYHARAAYFASHGYAFALVDVRGRGNSSGEFEPFAQEPHDGHDVVKWLAQQPFCDGKVAMWGGSYAGFDQWATAKESPPHLCHYRAGRRGTSATRLPLPNEHRALERSTPSALSRIQTCQTGRNREMRI
jgi:hypothetical protein